MSDYQPTAWVDGGDPAITAAELNRIDQGVKTALDGNDANASAARAAQQRADKGVQDAATAQTAAKKAQATADQAVQDAKRAQKTADGANATATSTAKYAQPAWDKAVSNENRIKKLETGGTGAGVDAYVDSVKLARPLIQAGTFKVNNTEATLTFPQAFKTAPTVVGTLKTGGRVDNFVYISEVTATTCRFGAYSTGTRSANISWIAVGEAS